MSVNGMKREKGEQIRIVEKEQYTFSPGQFFRP